MPRRNMFTIYDVMEAKGVFEQNPANVNSRDSTGKNLYKGPQRYPRMLYHPEGKERVLSPGDVQVSPLYGPQLMNRQVEVTSQIVENAEEEAKLLALGWHRHPSDAIRARLVLEGKDPGEAPPITNLQRTEDLESEIARLTAELKASKGTQPAASANAKPPGPASAGL